MFGGLGESAAAQSRIPCFILLSFFSLPLFQNMSSGNESFYSLPPPTSVAWEPRGVLKELARKGLGKGKGGNFCNVVYGAVP